MKNIIGMLLPALRRADPTPPPQAPRVILGGDKAPELCMLAQDWPGWQDWAAATKTHKRVTQLKVDGIGAKYIAGRVVTREGVPMDCALHCIPGLRRLEEAMGCEMMFDGEYVEEDGFNATVAAFQKREGNGVFWIYDAIPYGAWVTGGSEIPIEQRLAAIQASLDAAESEFVGMLGWEMLDGPATAARAAELWALGYEGLVSKEPGSPYVRERSPMWLKVRKTYTEDLTVLDVIIENGLLKSIMVKGPSGPLRITTGWEKGYGGELVGHWERHDPESGPLVAECSFMLSTGVKRSVRSARFNRLRLDKSGGSVTAWAKRNSKIDRNWSNYRGQMKGGIK